MKFKTLDSLDLTPRAVTSTACENLSKARHSQKCEAQNILRRKTEAWQKHVPSLCRCGRTYAWCWLRLSRATAGRVGGGERGKGKEERNKRDRVCVCVCVLKTGVMRMP